MENHKKNSERNLWRLKSDRYAVSQVVSVLLIVALVISVMPVILFWGMPLIDEKKTENEIQTIYYSFEIIDNTIEGLLLEGSGAKRVVGIACPNENGDLSTDISIDNKLIVMYTYDDDYDFDISGLEETGVNDDVFSVSMTDPASSFTNAILYFLNPGGDYDYSEDADYIVPDDYNDPGDKENQLVNAGEIQANRNLEGNLLIDLYDTDVSAHPLARVWVFEIGSISYKAYYNAGTQRTAFENGVIMTYGIKNKGVVNAPTLIISNDKNSVALRVLQLNGLDVNSFSGRSTLEIMFNLVNSYRREKPTEFLINTHGDVGSHVSNLKFKFFGKNKETWKNYFTLMDEFDKIDSNTVEYNTVGINFILDSSFIDVDLGI